ncbi:ATP-binding protein [Streptomyces monomycini]|uniref:ATP-binding protein n=1 Tax=Streptomyces monomycini TaxID=371720 RepID=UPI00067CE526|nr:ATP-binding protein [Streptomyces monomycini]
MKVASQDELAISERSSASAESRLLDFMAMSYQPTSHAVGTPPLPRVDAHEVRDMRHDGTARLRQWAIRDEVVATADYVIGELVANAVLHGAVPGRDVALTLSRYESAIDVAATDGSPVLPRLPHASAAGQDTYESGRGLLLVRNVTAHLGGTWRFTRWNTGKVVTCTLPCDPVGDHRDRVAQFYDAARISEALVYLGQPGLYYADPGTWHRAHKVVRASLATLAPFAECRFRDLPKADPARYEIRAFLDWVRRLRADDAVKTHHLLAAVSRLLDLAEDAPRRA